MAAGVDGDSRPTSCSSRCLGFFDSFFSDLQASCDHVMTFKCSHRRSKGIKENLGCQCEASPSG